MPTQSDGAPVPPSGTRGCRPDIEIATGSEFRLVNRIKSSNFIWGELDSAELSFIVENRPRDGRGCPGKWLFDEMMGHFGEAVAFIRGNWTYGDNLSIVNTSMTSGGSAIDDAVRRTWTAARAAEWGFTGIHIITTIGQPGAYSSVQVLFGRN